MYISKGINCRLPNDSGRPKIERVARTIAISKYIVYMPPRKVKAFGAIDSRLVPASFWL